MKNAKKIIALILCTAISAGFTACGNTADDDNNSAEITSKSVSEQTVESDDTDNSSAANTDNSRVLIAYFSIPEDVDTDGVDAVAGASIVVSDGEKLGNIEYTARLVQQTVGGDLFRIETVQDYPLDHEKLVDFAADEQSINDRPELSKIFPQTKILQTSKTKSEDFLHSYFTRQTFRFLFGRLFIYTN